MFVRICNGGYMKNVIKVEGLTKKYKELVAVNNLSFEVNKGEFVAIMGGQWKWKNNFTKLYFYY